jgi:hypothetical protein
MLGCWAAELSEDAQALRDPLEGALLWLLLCALARALLAFFALEDWGMM